jgi:hypothetical protein
MKASRYEKRRKFIVLLKLVRRHSVTLRFTILQWRQPFSQRLIVWHHKPEWLLRRLGGFR